MQNRIYVYGIIKTNDPQEFGAIGIENTTASNVTTIGFKDVAAVVSVVPFVTYDSLVQETTLKHLAIHQLVIEKVMAKFTILPVKFGTMLTDNEEVRTFLKKGYAFLSKQLSIMEGKIELDLVAWWDLATILPALSRQNNQIQTKQQEITAKGQNTSIEDKIVLGKYVDQAVQAEKSRSQRLIEQALGKEVEDICQHDLANDQMIFNSAFLLARDKEDQFQDILQTLDKTLEERINFRVVGPLPPYSFATVLFRKIDADTIEGAKNTLGLSEEVTPQNLRDAYHRFAKKYHPDAQTQEHTKDFQRIHTAYSTLKTFLEQGSFSLELYDWQKDAK